MSGLAAAYPPAMNDLLAGALARTALLAAEPDEPPERSAGGHIADGRHLGTDVAAACETARHTPPRWASLRNRRPASLSQLRAEALPGDIYHPSRPTKPPIRRAAELRAEREREAADPSSAAAAAARRARIAAGPVHISQLFLDGVYSSVVEPWLRLADRAAADLRAGKRAGVRVPTVTIRQCQMQSWARGVV